MGVRKYGEGTILDITLFILPIQNAPSQVLRYLHDLDLSSLVDNHLLRTF